MKKKWFIVFYIGYPKFGGNQNVGNISIELRNGPFLNREETVQAIKDIHPNLHSVSITNFIEVSEVEYNVWN